MIDFTIKNGWILSVLYLLVSYGTVIFGRQATRRLVNFSWMTKDLMKNTILVTLCYFGILIYPIFLEIRTGSFYFVIGVFLVILGSVCTIISFANYFTSSLDKVITKGLYQVSRNPIYVSISVVALGMALMTHSWIIFLFLTINSIAQHPIVLAEERYCYSSYGQEYMNYKDKVARYFVFI